MITSLGRTASPFASCRAEWCRRAFATSAYAETSSHSPMPPKFKKRADTRNDRAIVNIKEGSSRLFVRPWDGVPGMPDGFAMLRGIEKKYGKIKSFKFIRDGEIPSTYFSYFWVELEDPLRYSAAGTTVLQIPVPEVERKRPGGVGITDLQPFLRPPLEAQEEPHEWIGVTERMVDQVDESKRVSKVYDLRLEPSIIPRTPFQVIGRREYHELTDAFVKWGGFAPSPIQGAEASGPSARPTLDSLIARAPQFFKTERRSAAKKDEGPPIEEPHIPFNYEFDEPVYITDTQTSEPSKANDVSPGKSQSLLTMRREGKRLSKKQKALLQAAAISRTPLPKFEEKPLVVAKEHEERDSNDAEVVQEPIAETEEEKKRIHSRVWDLVRSKWF